MGGNTACVVGELSMRSTLAPCVVGGQEVCSAVFSIQVRGCCVDVITSSRLVPAWCWGSAGLLIADDSGTHCGASQRLWEVGVHSTAQHCTGSGC